MDTRWLTLSTTIGWVLQRRDDARKSFLEYVPAQKEYKNTLPLNSGYKGIKKSLEENEKLVVCRV